MKRAIQSALLLLAAAGTVGGLAEAQQARRGSIYSHHQGPFGLVANKTAARPGDLVTILINETTDVTDEQRSNFKRETDLNYSLDSFNIAPDAFSVLPDIGASSLDDFKGEARQEKRGQFTARLTAMVVDVLPNGNLVLKGRREVRVDQQVKTIEFSGIVRRYDIRQNNTVESELVANAKVAYTGHGPSTESTNRVGLGGMIHSALVWLWPF
jgi:flagellar L-ring protein precursor FlgH